MANKKEVLEGIEEEITEEVSEEELLTTFKAKLIEKNIQEDDIILCPKSTSKNMDFNFKEKDKWICLEAKTFNDPRSNSNGFLSLFGKILKGRTFEKNEQFRGCNNFEYGFLFWYKDIEIIYKYFKENVKYEDLEVFLNNFNVQRIYFVDNNTCNLKLKDTFLKEIKNKR